MALYGNAAKRKGQGSGDQPGPNNRALTTGGDEPKGGPILKITFAGLLSCNGPDPIRKGPGGSCLAHLDPNNRVSRELTKGTRS